MSIRTGSRNNITYIYELPYTERKDLCNILDMNDDWVTLGGDKMKFSVVKLDEIRRAEKSGNSPADKLLMLWGQKNNTILQLYLLLYEMDHYQAMNVLLPFVPEEYSLERLTKVESNCDSKMKRPIKPPSHLLEPLRSDTMHSDHNLNQAIALNASSHRPIESMNKNIPQQFFENENNSAGGCNPYKIMSLDSKKQSVSDEKHKILNQLPNKFQKQSNTGMHKKASVEVNAAAKYPKGQNPSKMFQENAKAVTTTSLNESAFSEIDQITKQQGHSAKAINSNIATNSAMSQCGVPKIEFQDLEDATSNWNKQHRLGSGGFGTVYKGFWINMDVAIKRINPVAENKAPNLKDHNVNQTLDELRYLQKFRHDNILQLYGYSYEPDHPFCLVYQFMPNGSLEYRLQCKKVEGFGDKIPKPLNWYRRFCIAKGTAAALEYLHTAFVDKPLIHGDVKSANILLDRNLEPKLGDFGLAREGPENKSTSVQVTIVHGTKPYIPDEYLRSKKLSVKVDAYSYGIVLFEICTGNRAYNDKTRKLLKDEVLSKDIKGGPDPVNVFETLLDIGRDCIRSNPKKRPELKMVFQELKTFSKALPKEDPMLLTDSTSPMTIHQLHDRPTYPSHPTFQNVPTFLHHSRVPTSHLINQIAPSLPYPSLHGYSPSNPSRSPVISGAGMPIPISSWVKGLQNHATGGSVYPIHVTPGIQNDHLYGKSITESTTPNEVINSPKKDLDLQEESPLPDFSRLMFQSPDMSPNLDQTMSSSDDSSDLDSGTKNADAFDSDLMKQSDNNPPKNYDQPSLIPTLLDQTSGTNSSKEYAPVTAVGKKSLI